MSFVFYCTVFTSSALAVDIPLLTDSDGNRMVNLQGLTYPHRITLVSQSRSYRRREEYWGDLEVIGEHFNVVLVGEDRYSNFTYLSLMHEFQDSYTDYNLLGIGRGGDLLTAAGSASVVGFHNTTGLLILDSSEEEFLNRFCFEGAHLRVPFLRRRIFGLESVSLYGSFRIGGHERAQLALISIELSDIPSLLSLPDRRASILFSAIGSYTIVNDRPRFGDCQRVITHLPQIDIVFSRTHDAMSELGTIPLLPEDYVRNIGGDSCELLIAHGPSAMMYFNPLLLSGVNLRISEDQLIICDAI